MGLGKALLSVSAVPGATGMLGTIILFALAFAGMASAGIPSILNVSSATQNGAYAAGASIATLTSPQ